MSKSLSLLLALLCLAPPTLSARSLSAQSKQSDRVTVAPTSTTTVRLTGHMPLWATPANDAGPVEDATPLHLTFLLARAPEQEAAFTQLLADQQNPASPGYHRWLTPQQVGELYGPTQHDVDALTAWLATRNLTAPELSPSRIFLTLTAPVSTVAAALSIGFRYFMLAGEPRLSTTAEPALPAALAAIVQSVNGLSDIPVHPMGHGVGMPASNAPATGVQPEFTNSSSGAHFVTPGDFANIFDLAIPYTAGYTGVGQRIAIIGRSRVVASDITEFEANTGLAANVFTTIVPNPLFDPGYPGNGDQSEATLDVGRALGTAPSAQVDLVILSNSGGGIYAAAQYAVNTLNDPIMNVSFGSCEINAGAASVHSWDTLFAQAASQGISVFVSSSDSGVATCDTQFGVPPLFQQRSINYICASSYTTCVGATEFADTANSSFWSTTNDVNRVSAFSYIPEGAWNEPTSTSSGVTTFVAASTGGGASLYIAKPSWQSGTGVPADGARDVPDVSYPGAAHDAYYACYAAGSGDCALSRYEYFYGTSTAAPTMAAVTAIVNQRTGVRQGNLNPTLYRLAANAANGVFHDATIASSGVSGCSVTIPSMCNNSTPSPTALTGGEPGFALTTGYDQATGLGSTDVNNLLTTVGPTQTASGIVLFASAPVIAVGGTATFSASVVSHGLSAPPGTPIPTGYVQFFLNGATLGPALSLPLSGSVSTAVIPFPVVATPAITAVYSGDPVYAVAKSSAVALSVQYPGFTIAASPSSLNLSPGATTANTAVLTYASVLGFAGVVNQSCTVTYTGSATLNYLPTCSFTAPTVTLIANASTTATITINSTTPHAVAAPGSPKYAASLWNSHAGLLAQGLALASLALVWLPRRSSRRRCMSLLAAFTVAVLSLSACGGGSNSTTPPLVGTSFGSYTVSLTSSSGSIVPIPAATLTLNVQ